MAMNEKHIGSDFDQFLLEEDLLADAQEECIKRVLAWTLKKEMKEHKISKISMAQKLNTSRAALDRILNPFNKSITLATIERVAEILGKRLVIRLENMPTVNT